MPDVGQKIAGRYVLIRKIGEGGMGSVFEAKHSQIGKTVAIKFLNEEFTNNRDALERFYQEAKLAGTLGHLNICEVIDFGITDEGIPFIVMEYLKGRSLDELISQEGKLEIKRALTIVEQILSALEEVHSRGVIHRDLKPENIFITDVKGYGEVVKILDFGISKVVGDEVGAMRLTRTGTMMGTAYYMSPEQVRGSRNVDCRTDIYACGVILYEMLTGEVPFGGTSLGQVFAKIIEQPTPDPRALSPELSVKVKELIKKAMNKNPERRFNSAEEFRNEVRRVKQEVDSRLKGKATSAISLANGAIALGRNMVDRVVEGVEKKDGKVIGLIGGIVGVLFVVFVVSTFLIISSLSEVDGEKKLLRDEGRKENRGEGSPPESKSSSQELVTIRITNLPPHALVTLNGRERHPPMNVERSHQPVSIVISARGYRSKKFNIKPLRNITLNGRLEPLRKKKKMKRKKKPTVGSDPFRALKNDLRKLFGRE